ncbi:hypothetical protein D3C80_1296530 [compost metagenome]
MLRPENLEEFPNLPAGKSVKPILMALYDFMRLVHELRVSVAILKNVYFVGVGDLHGIVPIVNFGVRGQCENSRKETDKVQKAPLWLEKSATHRKSPGCQKSIAKQEVTTPLLSCPLNRVIKYPLASHCISRPVISGDHTKDIHYRAVERFPTAPSHQK